MLWTCARLLAVVVVGLVGLDQKAFASNDEIYYFRPGIHISREHQLKDAQLETLLQGFRFWTGLKEIEIDNKGNLVLEDREFIEGGSSTARTLLLSAIDGEDSFTISSFENSSTIAFAQIESQDTYINGQGRRFTRWEIRLDFSDFGRLNGSTDVKQSFDPAINVAHELAHAVHRFDDLIQGEDRIGQCERFVNRMREEVGLPQRSEYYARYGNASRQDGSSFIQGELRFLDSSARETNLSFDVDQVFDRSGARSRGDVLAAQLSRRQNKQK